MTINLEALGITSEELTDRIVESAVQRILEFEGDVGGRIWQRLHQELESSIDAAVEKIGNEQLDALVQSLVEGITLQQTNKWGEEKGESVTFIEYLTQRAETYMQELVDFDGKKPDYHSRGSQTRITHLVERHLHYSIDSAVKAALKDVNSQLSQGISETVKLKLGEALERIKVEVRG